MAIATISFELAKEEYVNRFTMEHVPEWALRQAPNGRYYAPQYATDSEWFANTSFPPNNPTGNNVGCLSINHSWPLGQWLDRPFDPSNCGAPSMRAATSVTEDMSDKQIRDIIDNSIILCELADAFEDGLNVDDIKKAAAEVREALVSYGVIERVERTGAKP